MLKSHSQDKPRDFPEFIHFKPFPGPSSTLSPVHEEVFFSLKRRLWTFKKPVILNNSRFYSKKNRTINP